jgi:pimeloyl-ACP methyl ester carboxylesterase/RimJ/RimL family protein N-acetyltransferase
MLSLMPTAETLHTPRLRLEQWAESHTDMLLRLAARPEVTRHIGDGEPWPARRAVALAQANREHWRRHGFGWRAAVETGSGRPVGLIALGFAGEAAGVGADEYEIGWWLDPQAWGRGLAREGALALLDEAFERVGAPSVLARIQPGNRASLAVARALGLTPESSSTGRTGEAISVLRLTAPDWRQAARRRPLPISVESRGIEADELPGDSGRAPLVMLHEGLGSVGLWRDLPEALRRATGRRVIAFSRPGHGRSQTAPRRGGVTGFHHDQALRVLPEVLDHAWAQEPLLVGHSDGASIALIHAGRHAVSGLVLLAPHVFVEEMCVSAIRGTHRDYADGRLRERMLRHHDDPDAAFHGWCDMWLDPAFADWNLEDDAARVSVPMLLVQGRDDPYGTLEQIDRIEARAVGPVQRLVLSGGHSPHLEHPDAVVAAVAEFAARLP